VTIDVVLPTHLRTLAGVHAGVSLEVEGEVTTRAILDELRIAFRCFGARSATTRRSGAARS
jgi:hypothetical protein